MIVELVENGIVFLEFSLKTREENQLVLRDTEPSCEKYN